MTNIKIIIVLIISVSAMWSSGLFCRPTVKKVVQNSDIPTAIPPLSRTTTEDNNVKEEGLPYFDVAKVNECPGTREDYVPEGKAMCRHGDPSIEETVGAEEPDFTPFVDRCSWWGDIEWHGEHWGGVIPAKRRASVGIIPPRSLCASERVCLVGGYPCLGHKNSIKSNPIQFCPHHDGPIRISMEQCKGDIRCLKHIPDVCGDANKAGSGRTLLLIHQFWLVENHNIWHWMATMMDIFGAIIEADPELITHDGIFTPTSARVALLLQTQGFRQDKSLSKVGSNSPRSQWNPVKGPETQKVLSTLSTCPIEYPDPKDENCYQNVIMGTPTQLALQWEDRIYTKRDIRYADAFAKHLLRVAIGSEAEPLAGSPVPFPWNYLYQHRTQPVIFLGMRGEGRVQTTRQIVGIDILIAALEKVGFAIVKSDPSKDDPLFPQMLEVAKADVLLGVHGAALGWGLVLPPHGIVVELRPQRAIVDRTYIYPTLAAARDIEHIEYHQSEPITPSKDKRLALDTFFNVTVQSAQYLAATIMRKLIKRAPQFRKVPLWHRRKSPK
eukprot:TRINITY_DN11155_c0_g1_i1.p1 TRINITY_DN11155_c0_g1~~TRINITY_DN11155_c0_g1_i1.p1  ORF type:complete len:553 (+),score=66.82 TRINITY_DN11155_c0_g1_i1:50-1708(+)